MAPAGTRWNYSTGETNLVGLPVSQATKRPLAQYRSEKIWMPAGVERQATWILSKTGQEIGGCCIQAATRDFARLGVFVLNGAKAGSQSIVPDGWLADGTSERIGIGQPGRGQGYLSWTYGDGSFTARGIFGQGIFIDLKRWLASHPTPTGAPAPPTRPPGERAMPSTAPCRRRSTPSRQLPPSQPFTAPAPARTRRRSSARRRCVH